MGEQAESYALEEVPPSHGAPCRGCRRRQGLTAAALLGGFGYLWGLSEVAVLPVGLLEHLELAGPFLGIAGLLAAAQTWLPPGRNPRPVLSGAALLGISAVATQLFLMTIGDSGACIPEPGNPWIAVPAGLVAAASFLFAGSTLAEAGARALGIPSRRGRAALAAGAVSSLFLTVLLGLLLLKGRPPGELAQAELARMLVFLAGSAALASALGPAGPGEATLLESAPGGLPTPALDS